MHLLRNAGDDVTITVEYLREAPSFLKLPLGKWEGERFLGCYGVLFLPTLFIHMSWHSGNKLFPKHMLREKIDLDGGASTTGF